MKTIGVVGGMSWESSKVYYEYLNQMVSSQLGGSHSAKIFMSSVDFSEVERYTFQDDWDKIGHLMAVHSRKLEAAGADVIVLATNTIHIVSDAIQNAIEIPFLHIANATGEAIVKKELGKVGLLGTRFTMERDFYTKILEEEYALQVIIPEEDDRQLLQNIIYNELVKGKFTEESKNECLRIIQSLQNKGAEGIILGCTELPILIPDNEVALPTFNTTAIHSQKAVDFALS